MTADSRDTSHLVPKLPEADQHAATNDPNGVDSAVKHMFGRGSLYLVIWTLQIATNTAVGPLITRRLGPGHYGQVAAATSLMFVFSSLFNLGLQTAIQRTYASRNGERTALGLVTPSILISFTFTGLTIATCRWWAVYIGFGNDLSILRAALLWSGLAAATQPCFVLLRSQDRIHIFAIASIIQSLFAQAGGIALIIFYQPTAISYLSGMILGEFAALLILAIATKPPISGLFAFRETKAALAFGIPLIPHLTALFVLTAGDRIVVLHDLGNTQVGRYQVTYNLASIGIVLLGAVITVWLPRLYAVNNDSDRWLVLAYTRNHVFHLLFPLTVGLSIGTTAVLHFYAPSSYKTAMLSSVAVTVALSSFPFALYILNSQALLWAKRTPTLALCTTISAFANIVLNIILVPHLHIFGSALATLMSYSLLGGVVKMLVRRSVTLNTTPNSVWYALIASSILSISTIAAPNSGIWLYVRLLAASACGIFFLFSVRKIARPQAIQHAPIAI